MLQIDIIILHANIFIPHVDIFGGKITAQNREKYAIIHIRSNEYKLQSEIMIDGQKLTIAVLQEKKNSEL